jgi:hypothetical protein
MLRKGGISRTSGGEAAAARLGGGQQSVTPGRAGRQAPRLRGVRTPCLARLAAEQCASEAAKQGTSEAAACSEAASERIRAIGRGMSELE